MEKEDEDSLQERLIEYFAVIGPAGAASISKDRESSQIFDSFLSMQEANLPETEEEQEEGKEGKEGKEEEALEDPKQEGINQEQKKKGREEAEGDKDEQSKEKGESETKSKGEEKEKGGEGGEGEGEGEGEQEGEGRRREEREAMEDPEGSKKESPPQLPYLFGVPSWSEDPIWSLQVVKPTLGDHVLLSCLL